MTGNKKDKPQVIGALRVNYDKGDSVIDIQESARENAIDFLHELCEKKRSRGNVTTAVGRKYSR